MVDFNFVFNEHIPSVAVEAVKRAGQRWSSVFKDDVTVNIAIEPATLPEQVIGSAYPSFVRADYGEMLNQFALDETSQLDATANQYLPTVVSENGGIRRIINRPEDSSRLRSDDSASNLWLTRANAKALGVVPGGDSTFDGVIRFSTAINWDASVDNGINDAKYSLTGVATHEIGHILGFVSGLDLLDFDLREGTFQSGKTYDYISPMDLYRQSTLTVGKPGIHWAVENRKQYLSLDNQTYAAQMARGLSIDRADGNFQASHFAITEDAAMRPTLASGAVNKMTALDVKLLDVMGWDQSTGSGVDYQSSAAAYTVDPDGFDASLRRARKNKGNTSTSFWQEQGLSMTASDSLPLTTIEGTESQDTLQGEQANERILGLGDDDWLHGGAGDDVLNGNMGDDVVKGGSGTDYLLGGGGSDRLVGGAGADVFVVQDKSGTDRVKDFQIGIDQLALSQPLSLGQSDMGQLSLSPQGDDTVISLGDRSLMVLEGTRSNQITAAAFVNELAIESAIESAIEFSN
ncbi:MAG: NF038122 family metalloprotease [Leptolyngbyaceae cyanobacterium]